MEFRSINRHCSYFHGAVNIGYVRQGEQGLLIDTGIDASTMKKVLRQLQEKKLPVTHLFITHAHADHYGGAAHLQAEHAVHTIAPVLEAAILRHPILEPLYLFGGNDPLPELRNKFLEGSPVRIDEAIEEGKHRTGNFSFTTHSLPGHSYNQLGLFIHDVLYAGDAYFSEAQLHKHKIPFLTDAALAMESLDKLTRLSCQGAVPGHGEYEKDFLPTVRANRDYHQTLLDWLEEKVRQEGSISHENLIAEMCEAFRVSASVLSQWLLFRTAVTAYLLALLKQNKISGSIEKGRWMFRLNNS